MAQRLVLRLRLAPASSPGHVLGWSVVRSGPDVVRLEAGGALVRAVIEGRRHGRTSTIATSLWDATALARLLLERAAASSRVGP